MALKHSGRYAIYYINKGKDRNDSLAGIQSGDHLRFWKKLKVADGVDLQNTPASETGSTITEDLVLQNTVLISVSSNATIPLEVSLRGIDDFLASILGTSNPEQGSMTVLDLDAKAGIEDAEEGKDYSFVFTRNSSFEDSTSEEDFFTVGASYLIEENLIEDTDNIFDVTDITTGTWTVSDTNIDTTPTLTSGQLDFDISSDIDIDEITLTSPADTGGLFSVYDSSNVTMKFEFKDSNDAPSEELIDIDLIRFQYRIGAGDQWFGLNQDDAQFHKYGKIGFNTESREIEFKINELTFDEDGDVEATTPKPLAQFRIIIKFADSVSLKAADHDISITALTVTRIEDKARGAAVANYGVYTLAGTRQASDTGGGTVYEVEFLNPSGTINEGIDVVNDKDYTFLRHHMVNQTGNDIQSLDYYAFETVNSAISASGSGSATAHSLFDNQTVNSLDLSMQPDSIFTASLATTGLEAGKTNLSESDSGVAKTSYIDRSDAASAPLSSAYGEQFVLYDYDDIQKGIYTPLRNVTATALDISISNAVAQANSAFNEGSPVDSARTAIRITGTLTVLNETPTYDADGDVVEGQEGSSLDAYIGEIGESRKFLYGEVHLDSPDGGIKILKLFKIGIESATDGPVSGEDLIPQSHDIVLLGDEQVRLLGVDTIRPTTEVS